MQRFDQGINNGTLAWLFIGANDTTYGHDVLFYDIPWRVEFLSLENIPVQNKTFNGTGFSDLWPLGTPNVNNLSTLVPAVNASYSNAASILLCDPHIRNATRLINLVNQTFTVHDAPSGRDKAVDTSESEGEWGRDDGAGSVLSNILNPLLGGASQKFSARRSREYAIPYSPVNWVVGVLTLQALTNSSAENGLVNGIAYYDIPLPPEEIASTIGSYVQSAAKSYLVRGLLPIATHNIAAGRDAQNAQVLLPVTVLQTSLEQMYATVGLVVLILILALTILIVGVGSLPLMVSTVQAVLQERSNGDR